MDPLVEVKLPVGERAVLHTSGVWVYVIHSNEGVIVDMFNEDGDLLDTMACDIEAGERAAYLEGEPCSRGSAS